MPLKTLIITGTLRNWMPDHGAPIVWGEIYDDVKERWADGTMIHTSAVLDHLETEDAYYIFTINSVYKLPKEARRGSQTLSGTLVPGY